MNIKDLIKTIAYMIWKPALQSIIVIVLLLSIERNYITILLTIISVNLYFKLTDSLIYKEKPIIKEWFNSIFWTIIIVSAIYFVVFLLGAYGLIGSILIVLIIAGYKIYLGWDAFDKVTTWGAERLKGKHNKNFNLEEVKK